MIQSNNLIHKRGKRHYDAVIKETIVDTSALIKSCRISNIINTTPLDAPRIASLDQCRGVCILLMIGGNFAGKFVFMPWILTHHKYGLTIAEIFGPVFFLMVGFGYRMSFLKRKEKYGIQAAVYSSLRRHLFIFVVGLIVYFGHFWDALTHIGMIGVLLLPVIALPWPVRVATAVAFITIYQACFHLTGYGEWLMSFDYSLNGGPLAAFSWGFIVLFGTVVYDCWANRQQQSITKTLLLIGLFLCLFGYLLSIPWPGLKEDWPFTRYGMTAPYPVFTTGTAILIFFLFYRLSDEKGWKIPLAAPMGANPLLMYGMMGAFIGTSKLIIQVYGEPNFYVALASYIGICLACYGVANSLYKRGISLRAS